MSQHIYIKKSYLHIFWSDVKQFLFADIKIRKWCIPRHFLMLAIISQIHFQELLQKPCRRVPGCHAHITVSSKNPRSSFNHFASKPEGIKLPNLSIFCSAMLCTPLLILFLCSAVVNKPLLSTSRQTSSVFPHYLWMLYFTVLDLTLFSYCFEKFSARVLPVMCDTESDITPNITQIERASWAQKYR